jgi:transposase InsO family protein
VRPAQNLRARQAQSSVRQAAARSAHGAVKRRPHQNSYVERFNGRLRDECLNEHRFFSLGQALETIETWRLDYNAV